MHFPMFADVRHSTNLSQDYCQRSRIDVTHLDIFYPKNKYEANSWVAIISVIILF